MAWRQAGDAERVLRRFASDLPYVLAEAVNEAHTMIQGPDKRRAAGLLCGVWFVASTRVLDRLREDLPGIGELQCTPEAIERLKKLGME
jgi:hypothetical protein